MELLGHTFSSVFSFFLRHFHTVFHTSTPSAHHESDLTEGLKHTHAWSYSCAQLEVNTPVNPMNGLSRARLCDVGASPRRTVGALQERNSFPRLRLSVQFVHVRRSIHIPPQGRVMTLSTPVVVVQSLSHVRLCIPVGCRTPGFPVLECRPEFAQTHVH